MHLRLAVVVCKALELMVEKCASTMEGGNKSASAIVLRIFECIASGLLLEGTSTLGAIAVPLSGN